MPMFRYQNIKPLSANSDVLLANATELREVKYASGYTTNASIYLTSEGDFTYYRREASHSMIVTDGRLKLAVNENKIRGVFEFDSLDYFYVQNSKPLATASETDSILATGLYKGLDDFSLWHQDDWWYRVTTTYYAGFEIPDVGNPSNKEKAIGAEAVRLRESVSTGGQTLSFDSSAWGRGKNLDYRQYRKVVLENLTDEFCQAFDPNQITIEESIRSAVQPILEGRVVIQRSSGSATNVTSVLRNSKSDPLTTALVSSLNNLDEVLSL